MEKSIKRRTCQFDSTIGTVFKFFVIVCFVLLIGVECVSAATIVVNQMSPANTSGDFYCGTIKESRNIAENGDTIIVCEGIYRENVVIDKPLVLKALGNVTIEARDDSATVVWIKAHNVVVSGFNVKRGNVGIRLDNVQNCKIENNNVFENDFGIALISSCNNSIVKNVAFKNKVYGVILQDFSNDNQIENNIASHNTYGIVLKNSSNNIIGNNNASWAGYGVVLDSSTGNTIVNNIAFNNEVHGIHLQDYSNNNKIENNTIYENSDSGLYIGDSTENVVCNNRVNKNLNGIRLDSANTNEITNNTACENVCGICLVDSYGNKISNNIINKNLDGISLHASNTNEITNNTASENGDNGIFLLNSSDNEVSNNIVNKNLDGISLLRESNKVIIENNTACENGDIGINIGYSSENEVCNNNVNKNTGGISLSNSNNNKLENNTASENFYSGIQLADSSNNEINSNILNWNLFGIVLHASSNNKINDNTACENDDMGICLQRDSSGNVVCNNLFNKNLAGIILMESDTNEITNNTACENIQGGLDMQQGTSWNTINNNIFYKNLGSGIYLSLGTYYNTVTNNNIIDNKFYQVSIEDSYLNEFNHNYWSDYAGEDENKDGVGDEPYVIDEANKEDYPYMNYSGWLNVVITPEYWYFFAKKGDLINITFNIENRFNRATDIEMLLDDNLNIGTEIDATKKIRSFSIKPKSTHNITVGLNTTNLEGYILRKITFKTEGYSKTTLVNGFVQPKIHDVKIEGVDFYNNIVKGQINPFRIILRNQGDKDEFDVTLKMGNEENQKRLYLYENETRTIPFEIDTSNLPLGITNGHVVVSKGRRLDYLNLTIFVASKLEASTLVVANLKRMAEMWGDDAASQLKDKVLDLCFHPTVNGIIVYVEDDKNCSTLYDDWDNDKSPWKANEIAKAIKGLIDSKCKAYQNVDYLVIVGDDRIIPFYRVFDNTDKPFVSRSWYTECDYDKLTINSSVGSALHNNMFLTDNFYATDEEMEWKTVEADISELFIPTIPVGRLVESPGDISAVIDAFFHDDTINPDKVFVTGIGFMGDSASNCSSTLEQKTGGYLTTVISRNFEAVTRDYFDNIEQGLLNTSNDIALIFQHAEHDRFKIPKYFVEKKNVEYEYEYITSQNISTATGLNGSIVCSLGGHAGLNVPPKASIDDFDLAQAFAQRGVLAYIAPTSYSIGLFRTIGAHERLLFYFTNYLCEGMDVGTALTLAKQEYWATNYDIGYIDEQVLETTTLYGLPMTRINIPRSNTSYNKSKMKIMSIEHEKPDCLVISPTYTPINISTPLTIPNKITYYKSASGELFVEPNAPVQPKEVRIFYPTPTRMLHGAVLTSAQYQDKSIIPLIDTFMQSPTQGTKFEEFEYPGIEDWYPARIFKLKTINYPRGPAESRQYLIVVTGQYKGPTVATPLLEGRKERLYDNLSFQLYYASSDAETTAPTIRNIYRTWINDTIKILVNVSDESGIQRVLVTYTDDKGEWKSKDLIKTGELWTCKIPMDVISEFFVQAVDNNGNVAVGVQRGI